MTEETADAARREIVSHYEALRAQISRAVHCPHQGSDLVQEAYHRAFRYLGRRDLPRDSQAWFRAIAWNLVRNHFRNRSLRAPAEVLDETLLVDEPGLDPAWDDTPFDVDLEYLSEAIESLSPIPRALIIGFYFEGKGCRELGECFGIRHSTVKCRLYRARKRIGRWLLDREEVRHD